MSKPGRRTKAQAQRSKRIAMNKNAARVLPRPMSERLSEAARIAGATAGTVTLASALTATPVHALPQNGTVVGGSVSIAQSGSNLSIKQGTNSAIINWQGYNIGAGESVQYLQPGSNSIILNRVTGADPSAIYGNLSANGQVWVINPNGLVVGEGARVETASFLGSTLGISNEDFSAGNFRFTGASLSSIINRGNIKAADGGYVVLAAPSVTNNGLISANLGKVFLSSGEQLTLGFQGNDLIELVITEEAASGALGVKNTGTITADGGTVVLSAKVAADLLQGVVNNEGIIRATSIVERDGAIILDGGEHGMVANSGTLDASGRDAGEKGGEIKVLGDQVALSSTALLDASGDAGGGTVLVGGNFHGAGAERNATVTTIAQGAAVKADAITDGDGGKVAVWSDGATEFHGRISAVGGAAGGNGGRAEVSGKTDLALTGFADLRAPNGEAGNLEIDPGSVTIIGGVVGPNPEADTITDGWISTQLESGNLEISTSDSTSGGSENITLASDVGIAWNSGNTLTLSAGKDITLGGSIAAAAGRLDLNFDTSGTGGNFYFENAHVDAATVHISGSGSTSWLHGPTDGSTTFTVSGPDRGRINGTWDFENVGWLGGGFGDELFIIEKFGSLSSGVAAANGYDTLDLSAKENAWFDHNANSATDVPCIDGIQQVIGNGANSTFIGRWAEYTYNVTGVNSGNVEFNQVAVLDFRGFGRVTGSNANETFNFHDGGSLSGAIDAGQGEDTLSYASRTGDVEINMQTSSATGMGQPFSGFERLVGNGARSVIAGADAGESFTVSGADAGTVGALGFTGVGNLTGGSGADTFVFQSGGSLTGRVDGGGVSGDNVSDILDLSAISSITVDRERNTVVDIIGSLSGIERAVGNGSDSTIVGNNNGETFTVTGRNAGTVDSGTDALEFTGFNNLTGGQGADSFIIQDGASLAGTLAGGGSAGDGVEDTLDLHALNSDIIFDLETRKATGIDGTYDGIEAVVGNGVRSTIVGTEAGQSFEVAGADAGSAGGLNFRDVGNLRGGSGADTFEIYDAASLSGGLVGGGTVGDGVKDRLDLRDSSSATLNRETSTVNGISFSGIEIAIGPKSDSTIIGRNSGERFIITGRDSGTVDSGSFDVLQFAGFKNIIGGSGADLFVIHDRGTLSGALVGGGTANDGVDDTLDMSAKIREVTFDQKSDQATDIGGTFSGIESVVGNGAKSTIVGRDAGETFEVTGHDTGTAGQLKFREVGNLTGGSGADSFIIHDAGRLSGKVAGGGSMGDEVNDSLDLSAKTKGVTFDQGTSEATDIGGFSQIESVVGNGVDSTIVGSDLAQTFKLTGENSGTAGYLQFSKVGNLTGGSGADVFVVRDGGSLSGKADGGLGIDTLSYAQRTGEVIIEQQPDKATGLGGFVGVERVVGNGNGSTIRGADGGEVFTLTAANGGTAGALNFTEVANLTGGSGEDTFVFEAPGTLSGNLAGGAGNDTLDLRAKTEVTIDQQEHAATGVGRRYSGIERAIGNGANSTITGHDRGEIFIVTGLNSGTADANAPDAEGGAPQPDRLEFEGFGNLKGGALDDYFYLKADGRLTGNLDGGLDVDHLYLSQKSGPITLNLEQNTVTGVDKSFTGIESVSGNGANSTIIGHDQGDSFTIQRPDSGRVEWESSGTLAFESFGNIVGGGGDDRFIGYGGSLTGSITDSGGHATLGGALTTNSGQSYAGPATLESDTTLKASIVALNGVEGNGNDLTVEGDAVFNGSDVTGVKQLQVTGAAHVNVAVISASGAQLYDGLVTLGRDASLSGSAINVNAVAGGAHDLTLTASGTGGITIMGAVATSGDVALTASQGAITESGFGTVSAASLTTRSGEGQMLEGANSVSAFEAANSGTGSITFNNSSESLVVTGISNGAGSTRVASSGSISLTGGINTAGDVGLTAGDGGILVSGEIKTAENVALTAGSGDISLAGNIDGRDIDVTAEGGSIAVDGEMYSGGAVALEAANGVTLPGRITSAGNVELTAGNDISLAGGIDTVANVQLTSRGGSITESGAGSVNAPLLTTNSKGGQNLNGTNRVASFHATNAGGGTVTINNTAPTLTIQAIEQLDGGAISVTNIGNISVPGSVTSADDIVLSAKAASNAASDIDLAGKIESGKDVDLVAEGGISEGAAGSIKAAALTATSRGGQNLLGGNSVTAFAATNAGGGAIAFKNAGSGLSLGNITQSSGGAVSITNAADVRITGTTRTAGTDSVAITSTNGSIKSGGGSLEAGALELTAAAIGAEHGAPINIKAFSVTTNTNKEIDGLSAAFTGAASAFTVHDAAPSVVLLNGVVVGGQLSKNFQGAAQLGGLNAAMAVNAQEMQKMLMLANFQEFFAQPPKVPSLDAEDTTYTPVQQIIPGFLSDGRPCQLIDSKIK